MEQNANAANAGMPSVSDAIEKIMAHPELISMVASVLGAPTASAKESDSIDDSQGQEVAVADAKAESTEAVGVSTPVTSNSSSDWMATLAPLLSTLGGGKGGKGKLPDDPRSCLLRALKPYVSQGRKEAIDYMIRLAELSDLIKHLH